MSEDKRFLRHLEKSKEWRLTTLRAKASTAMQKAIRAESGAFVGNVKCVVNGVVETVYSQLGQVVCVTCGVGMPWSSTGTHAGHFLGSRNAYIVFEELGVHPQCANCNKHQSGKPEAYRIYMLDVYGQEIIEDLERRKRGWFLDEDGNEQRLEPLTREQLVLKRISYLDRIKAAEDIIKGVPRMAKTATKEKPASKPAGKQLVAYEPRQMTFEFDYAAAGLKPAQAEVLDGHADQVHHSQERMRFESVSRQMEMAAGIASAKKQFRGEKGEATWADWCKQRLGMHRSRCDKAIQIHNAFGKVSVDTLVGLPPTRFAKLAQDQHAPARKLALKHAATHYLNETDVDALLNESADDVEFKVDVTATTEQLKEKLVKKVSAIAKRLSDDLKGEVPDVLRAVADEMDKE